jgi:hypothetical protein
MRKRKKGNEGRKRERNGGRTKHRSNTFSEEVSK